MNLFSVKSTKTGKVIVDNFPAKREAKIHRDELNKNAGGIVCHVSLGPDHRHFQGA